jgi:phage shock protein C
VTENNYPEKVTIIENEIVVSEHNNDNANHDAEARRMLYRHPTDKRLGGVCGGIGDYLDIDPVLLRLGWILAAIVTGGVAILIYALMWIVLPTGTQKEGQTQKAAIDLGDHVMSKLAYLFIALGVLWLLANTGVLPHLWDGFWAVASILFWPAVLIVAGFLLLRKNGDAASIGEDVRQRMPDGETVKRTVKDTHQRMPLKRSVDDRVLLGVCGGIAQALKIDPIIVRILWALFSIGSIGVGVIIYVFLAILMPEDKSTEIQAVEGEILDPVMR